MTDILNSVTEVKRDVVEKSGNDVVSLVLIGGKLALVVVLLWTCIRVLAGLRQQTHRGGRATARATTEANTNVTASPDTRRRSAWEREQKRLDELAAAGLAAKQERLKLQQNTRAAALAVREAKVRARACTLKADKARMRRRRAEDQLRLSGDARDEQVVKLLQEEAEAAVQQDQIERKLLEQTLNKLEELQALLKLKEA